MQFRDRYGNVGNGLLDLDGKARKRAQSCPHRHLYPPTFGKTPRGPFRHVHCADCGGYVMGRYWQKHHA